MSFGIMPPSQGASQKGVKFPSLTVMVVAAAKQEVNHMQLLFQITGKSLICHKALLAVDKYGRATNSA